MDRLGKALQIGAQIANILALFPGAYCAYGTYTLLHSGVPQSSVSQPGAAMTHVVNPTFLIVSFIFFLLCFSSSAVLNLINTFRKPKVEKALEANLNQREKTKLIIHRAIYGAGAQGELDITESLRNAPRDALVIPVDNTLAAVDPALGVRKHLDVQYSYGDGVVYFVSRRESTPGDIVRLVLPEDSEAKKVDKLTAEVRQLKEKNEAATAAVPKLPDASKSIILTHYSHIDQMTPAKYDYSETATYKTKVRFHIRNSFDQPIEVWSPLWESEEILAQAPLCAKFAWKDKDGKPIEVQYITLTPYEEAKGWIGLLQPPSGDGLEFRLAHRTTGYLIFPLKVIGKMRYARLKL
jgi:hypothetical protein